MDYITSKDYAHLQELLGSGCEVVCFTKGIGVGMVRSVEDKKCGTCYEVTLNGRTIIDYWLDEDYSCTFADMLGDYGIEYIEPTVKRN